jgi:hypothetical protein
MHALFELVGGDGVGGDGGTGKCLAMRLPALQDHLEQCIAATLWSAS